MATSTASKSASTAVPAPARQPRKPRKKNKVSKDVEVPSDTANPTAQPNSRASSKESTVSHNASRASKDKSAKTQADITSSVAKKGGREKAHTPTTSERSEQVSSKPKGSGASATREGLSEQSELTMMRAQLAKEADARSKAEKELASLKKASKQKKTQRKPEKVPKPRGTAGKEFKLREAMGLADDKALYNDILDSVRVIALKASLDFKVGIRQQDAATLGAVYELAREAQPYLSHFINDWATAQILIQYLANRRKDLIKQGKLTITQDEDGHRVVRDTPKPKPGKVKPYLPSVIDEVQASGLGGGSEDAASLNGGSSDEDEVDTSLSSGSDTEGDGDNHPGASAEEDGVVVSPAPVSRASAVAFDSAADDPGSPADPPPSKKRKLAHVTPSNDS